MATFNQARYRYIDWIAERILEASELDRLQQIMQGVAPDDVTRWAWDLGAIYKEGATFNVTPTVAGTTVTLTATNSAQPMLVFVRGRWEILQTTEAVPVTLATGQTHLYLNWQLVIVNNTVDPSLVDSGTGEPTAEMGQLVLEVAAADTSTTALNTSLYFQQNSGPIVLFTFAVASGSGALTVVSSSGVKTQALASGAQAGMVSLTTTTSDGQALSSDDPSVTNTRNPNPLSVTDAAVRAPVLSGGSTQPIGTGAGQDPGGINTAKLVHVPTSQTGAAVIEAVRAQANATQAALAAHAPAPLGSGVHVMPTAAQVGAAPASHVGQVLGLSTSHPPEVDADSGGFEVLRDPGAAAAAMDPGFGILMANILQSGLLHNGDVYGILSQAITAYPGAADGDGAMTTTSLGLMSAIASVVVGHVNKVSHKNPHGITLADLGLSITYDFVANNGYIKFTMGTNSFMIQWGTGITGNSAPGTYFSFSPQFPNNCFGVYGTAVCTEGFDSAAFVLTGVSTGAPSTSGFYAYNSSPGSRIVYWIAIGN
jgi:hypothetical protein